MEEPPLERRDARKPQKTTRSSTEPQHILGTSWEGGPYPDAKMINHRYHLYKGLQEIATKAADDHRKDIDTLTKLTEKVEQAYNSLMANLRNQI